MCERSGGLSVSNRWGFVNKAGALDGFHHESRKVPSARHVALQNRVAHVAAPDGQTLFGALLWVAPAYHRPARLSSSSENKTQERKHRK